MIANRILKIEESSTLAMAQKSRDLIKQGKKIINLSLGEPDFETPQFIKNAAKEAIDNNFSKYTPVAGYDDLRSAISKKFLRDNKLNYTKDQIVCSTGAKQSRISRLCMHSSHCNRTGPRQMTYLSSPVSLLASPV